jgi:protein-disulfide isomerase
LLIAASAACVAICAVVATFAVITNLRRPTLSVRPDTVVTVQDWKRYAVGTRLGPDKATITITEFSDFQCPFCKQFAGDLQRLRARRPDIAVVFRHYPLDNVHPLARMAALAAECAADQGRFEAYHNTLFDAQDSLGRVPWATFASRAGVPDLARFRSCVDNGQTSSRVERDVRAGNELRVNGTPTVLINDRRYPEPPTLRLLDSLIDAAGVVPGRVVVAPGRR